MALPTVDVEFIVKLLNECKKVQGSFKKGQTTFYVMKGSAPVVNRMFIIRCVDDNHNQVDFDCAIGIAWKIKKLNEMVEWLKVNRNYNHG